MHIYEFKPNLTLLRPLGSKSLGVKICFFSMLDKVFGGFKFLQDIPTKSYLRLFFHSFIIYLNSNKILIQKVSNFIFNLVSNVPINHALNKFSNNLKAIP
jgi:hypothetical protein